MTGLEMRDGEIESGGARVCIFDVASGFMALRRSVENALGDATATLLYNAAFASYRDFAARAVNGGGLTRDESGFRDAVAAFREAGFGGFEVVEVEFPRARAVVECVEPMAFEAYGVIERRDGEMVPACDYARGALAGILSHLTNRKDRLCIETECRAQGDPRCLFEIGEERALTAKLLRQ